MAKRRKFNELDAATSTARPGNEKQLTLGDLVPDELWLSPLPLGNVQHLLSDHPLPCEVHLGISLELPLPTHYPLLTYLGQPLPGIDVPRPGRIVEVEVWHIWILEVDTTKRHG